jgi:peptidyl-prolyl cis-trans isomerase D
MLANIKNKTKGPVAYLIVGLITIPFALVGVNQFLEGQQNLAIASVGGDEITQTQYLPLLNRQQRSMQEQLGDNYTAQMEAELKQRTISSLINDKVLENLASDLGLATTISEVKEEILLNQNFYKDGKFDLEQYQTILRLNGYTTTEYEALILEQKTNLQLKENLLSSEFFTTSAKKQLNDLINQERNVAYAEFKNADFESKVKVNANEIKKYFDENSANFNNEKQIKVDFVELSTKTLLDKITANDTDLVAFYEDVKENYTTDETREASHILIEDEKLASEVLAKLKNGGDFAKLAKEYSIDDSNSGSGGELGFFGKGVMVPEFEEAVFAMQKDDLSDLIKTEFGYHIVKLTDILTGATKSFADVKNEVTKLYKTEQAKKQIFELSERMQTLAYDGDLEDIADELNLDIQTTDFITENDDKFERKFIIASFSNPVVEKDENVVAEITSDKIVAMRKNKFIPASPKTLSEATPAIKDILIKQKAKAEAQKQAQQVFNAKSSFGESRWIGRTGNSIPAEIVNFAFTLSQKNKENYGQQTFDDSSVVVKVSGVRTADKKDDENILNSLLNAYNDEVFNDILKELRKQTDIEIHNNRL